MDDKPEYQKPPKIADESIINDLVKMGRTENIGRSIFNALGIKA